jgi:hypothetical protein
MMTLVQWPWLFDPVPYEYSSKLKAAAAAAAAAAQRVTNGTVQTLKLGAKILSGKIARSVSSNEE